MPQLLRFLWLQRVIMQTALKQSLYTILQVLSVMSLDKTPILQAFSDWPELHENGIDSKQLSLFDL